MADKSENYTADEIYRYSTSVYFSSYNLPGSLIVTSNEESIDLMKLEWVTDNMIKECRFSIKANAKDVDDNDYVYTLSLRFRITEVGSLNLDYDWADDPDGYSTSDFFGFINFEFISYKEQPQLINSIEAGEGVSIETNDKNIVISTNIDTSGFATKEELDQKLDTYYGDNTFPYSEQGYYTDMERDVVYTVSSVDRGDETIYFEEGTHVSFWFEYDEWVKQVKSGDKIVLSLNENDDGYLYLNPIISTKDIFDEIKELSKEKADLVDGKVPIEQIPDEAKLFTINNSTRDIIIYEDILYQEVLRDDMIFPIEIAGVSTYIGIEGEEPFEEIQYELANPDGDHSVYGRGDYYSVSSYPDGSNISLTITGIPDKYRNEEYYGKKLYVANSYRTATIENHSSELVTAIIAGEGISFKNDKGELTIDTNLVQELALGTSIDPADKAPSAKAVTEALSFSAQGKNAKYNFTTPGWKRILNIIRTSNGTVNIGLATGGDNKMSQLLAFDFAGYVKYGADKTQGSPIILKKFENVFGNPSAVGEGGNPCKITKVRVAYPPRGAAYPNGDGIVGPGNPVNCYLDVYVDFDINENSGTKAFNMSYYGFAHSHNCETIMEETDASEFGIYGEELRYYEVDVATMPSYIASSDLDINDLLRKGNVHTVAENSASWGAYGVTMSSDGKLRTAYASNDDIDKGWNKYKIICPANLKYAVDKILRNYGLI